MVQNSDSDLSHYFNGMFSGMVVLTGILILLLISSTADAAPRKLVGWLGDAKGSVSVQREGKALEAKVGMLLREQDTIITGPKSNALIEMRGGDTVSLGYRSQFRINTYSTNKGGKIVEAKLSALLGKFRFVVRNLLNMDQYRVETTTAVLGVRGTDWFTDVGKKAVEVVTNDGKVGVTSQGKTVVVKAGEKVIVTDKGVGKKQKATNKDRKKFMDEGLEYAPSTLRDYLGEKTVPKCPECQAAADALNLEAQRYADLRKEFDRQFDKMRNSIENVKLFEKVVGEKNSLVSSNTELEELEEKYYSEERKLRGITARLHDSESSLQHAVKMFQRCEEEECREESWEDWGWKGVAVGGAVIGGGILIGSGGDGGSTSVTTPESPIADDPPPSNNPDPVMPDPTPDPPTAPPPAATLDGSYTVLCTLLSDPGLHNSFTGITANNPYTLLITVSGGTIMIAGSPPFVGLSGSIDPSGAFSAQGSGIVAGFPGTGVSGSGSFTGSGEPGTSLAFTYTMGTTGNLPGGFPVSYSCTGTIQ